MTHLWPPARLEAEALSLSGFLRFPYATADAVARFQPTSPGSRFCLSFWPGSDSCQPTSSFHAIYYRFGTAALQDADAFQIGNTCSTCELGSRKVEPVACRVVCGRIPWISNREVLTLPYKKIVWRCGAHNRLRTSGNSPVFCQTVQHPNRLKSAPELHARSLCLTSSPWHCYLPH